MKTENYLLIALFLFFNNFYAQIGIGTTSPDAQLDIRSSNQAAPASNDGILIPKVDAFPATNPTVAQQGMLVYLTTSTTFLATTRQPGFYYWNNPTSDWIGISSAANGDHDWYEETTTSPPNAITDDMFHTGNVAIGKNTADYPLEVQNTTLDTSVNLISDFSVSNATNKSGINNTITGTTADLVSGINNVINTPNTNFAAAIRNNLITNGNFTSGFYNQISSGAGDTYAINNEITTNSLNGFTFGVRNNLNHFGGAGRVVGSETLISTTGSATQYGVNNNLTNTGTGIRYGVNNSLTGGSSIFNQFGVKNLLNVPGGGTNYGVHNTIAASIASGNLIGMYNDIVGASPNNQIGVESNIAGTSVIGDYGVKNTLIGTGNGDKYGVRNDFTSSGTSINYGEYNSITGASNGLQYGNFNSISNTGTGDHLGVYNSLTGNGTGAKVGVRSQITSTNTGGIYGVNNIISGGGTSINYGTYSTLFGNSTGAQHGTYTEISNSSTGIHYGTLNRITGTGNGLKYGIRNELSGNGNQTGSFNILTGTGTGLQIGSYNEITTTNASAHTGVLSTMSGSGAGLKTGIYSYILPAAGGTHYGIYSEVLKAGATNFAGYFLGNVGIGTTAGNMYTLPPSRGTNGQIMQTNGTGVVTWQNPGSIAWLTTGNAGTVGGNTTTAGTNFIGTTDNQNIDFRTNNIFRARLSNLGEFFVGTLNTILPGDLCNSVGNATFPWAMNGYSDQNGAGTYGQVTGGTTIFAGVQGEYNGTNAQGAGVRGISLTGTVGAGFGTPHTGVSGNATTSGTYKFGVFGSGGTTARSGGVMGYDYGFGVGALGYYSFSGLDYSVYGFGQAHFNGIATGRIASNFSEKNTNIGLGIYGGVMGGWVRGMKFGFHTKGETYSLYVDGNGYTNKPLAYLISTDGASKTAGYMSTSMKPEVTVNGKANLENGKIFVAFDPSFQQIISNIDDVIITASPQGKSNGVYIDQITKEGFWIYENNEGTSNVKIAWIAITKIKGEENPEVPTELLANDFDRKMDGVMFNDNNEVDVAQSLWWDGTQIRWDKPTNDKVDKETERLARPKEAKK